MAVGCIEPQFYSKFLQGLNLQESGLESRDVKSNWPILRDIFTKKILEKTLSEWMNIFDNLDACVTPVLELSDLKSHPHHVSRKQTDSTSPLPAPRIQNQLFSVSDGPLIPGQNSLEVSIEVLGLNQVEILDLLESKILVQAKL